MKLRIGSGLPKYSEEKIWQCSKIIVPTLEATNDNLNFFCHQLKEKPRLNEEDTERNTETKAISIAADVHINIWCR